MWWDFLIVTAIVGLAAGYLVRRRLGRKGAMPECSSCGCSCQAGSSGGLQAGLPCSRRQEPFSSG